MLGYATSQHEALGGSKSSATGLGRIDLSIV
jgi:hypothetical protein